jgi:hypothetical protein
MTSQARRRLNGKSCHRSDEYLPQSPRPPDFRYIELGAVRGRALTSISGATGKVSHLVDADDVFVETAAVSDLTCLLQIADLLRAENLGTA